ncbi:MAG: transporter substrate-binding domain-containing protein [Chloroflexota bacterium]
MKKMFVLVNLVAIAALTLAACGQPTPVPTEPPATEPPATQPPATEPPAPADLLSTILERGYILVSTDPNYAPQSFLNTEGTRPADTKCPDDALTTAEMQGFDVDVAKAVGDFLGVETCFATPVWEMITAGAWADKWDVSVGSMTITPERQEVLDFSVPYYGTPAVVAVGKDSGFTSLDDLADKALCAGASTTYEVWLTGGDLGPSIAIFAQPPAGVTVVPLETDQECAQALAAGREDFAGYVTSVTVVNENIAAGLPVMQLGEPVFTEVLAAAFDRSSSLDTTTLREKVDELFTAMHADGRLSALSVQWFGIELTQVGE